MSRWLSIALFLSCILRFGYTERFETCGMYGTIRATGESSDRYCSYFGYVLCNSQQMKIRARRMSYLEYVFLKNIPQYPHFGPNPNPFFYLTAGCAEPFDLYPKQFWWVWDTFRTIWSLTVVSDLQSAALPMLPLRNWISTILFVNRSYYVLYVL